MTNINAQAALVELLNMIDALDAQGVLLNDEYDSCLKAIQVLALNIIKEG